MAQDEKKASDRIEVQMADLDIGDQFEFDGAVLTVSEPAQDIWGICEVWVEELDFPLMGSTARSTVHLRHDPRLSAT